MTPCTKERCVILVSGRDRVERLSFLRRLHRVIERHWRVGGFIAEEEVLEPAILRDGVTAGADVCFIGDIGAPAPKGKGFRSPAFSRCGAVIFGIEKDALPAVLATIAMTDSTIVDLDTTPVKKALRVVKQRLSRLDADRIGAFAGLIGLMEVGLGSTLHVYRVPLKGHLLSTIENLMLICSGKALNGRGLVRIAFISAMLKAFSPMGDRIRPMLYIFFQGLAFATPVHLLGWHAGSALAGSVLLGWLTLGISLVVDYATFGRSVFVAFEGAVDSAFRWMGLESPSLSYLIALAFMARAVLSVGVGIFAYFGNVQPLIRRLTIRRTTRNSRAHASGRARPTRATRQVATPVLAIFDLVQAHFIVGFLFSVLLMWFFADLTEAAFQQVVIRGLAISYLGFLLMRRVDVRALGARLDRVFKMDLAKSLPSALEMVEGARSRPSEENASTEKIEPRHSDAAWKTNRQLRAAAHTEPEREPIGVASGEIRR